MPLTLRKKFVFPELQNLISSWRSLALSRTRSVIRCYFKTVITTFHNLSICCIFTASIDLPPAGKCLRLFRGKVPQSKGDHIHHNLC